MLIMGGGLAGSLLARSIREASRRQSHQMFARLASRKAPGHTQIKSSLLGAMNNLFISKGIENTRMRELIFILTFQNRLMNTRYS